MEKILVNNQNIKEKKVKKEKTKRKFAFFETLKEKRILSLTGSWVFYFLSALIPLVFLMITAFSFFGMDISMEIAGKLPAEFRDVGETIVGTASNVSNSATFLFIVSVILSCSGLLNQMSKDGDYIYGVSHKKRKGLLRRVWVFAMLCVLFLMFTAFALLFSFRGVLLIKLGNGLKNLVTIISFVFIMLFGYAVLLVLNRFISPVRLKGVALALGSFASLCIVVLGSIGLIGYIRIFSSFNAFYGSLAGVVVFFFWAYVLMFGLLFGVFVCKSLNKGNIKEEETREEKVA